MNLIDLKLLLESRRFAVPNNLKFAVCAQTAAAILMVWCTCFAKEVAAYADTVSSPGLEIELSTSRPQVTAGAQFGITADVKNLSKNDVYLICSYFVMIPPLEIDPNGPEGWYPYIQGNQPLAHFNNNGDFHFDPIRLPPGDKLSAIWAGKNSLAPSDTEEKTWQATLYRNVKDLAHTVTFLPGDYTIKVTALYWPDEQSATEHRQNYRLQTADLKVSVSAPQWVIMLGAANGGGYCIPAVP